MPRKMTEMDAAKIPVMAKTKEQAELQRNWAGGNRNWGRQSRGEGVDFGENAAFYKTIIDHNLFRPLGWTPPKNEPSYSLVSTVVDSNGNGVISQATLLERRSNRYHFVTIGTKLGDITVKDIQADKVTLDKTGEAITLKTGGVQFLTAKRDRGGDRRGERDEGGSEKASNNNAAQNRAKMEADKRRQMEQKGRAAAERMRMEMMEKMRKASSEERREMIEQFRRRAGRRGRDR